MVEKLTQLSGNNSSGHSCSRHDNRTLLQNLRHLWHCDFKWPFVVPRTRCTCVITMLFYQLLDMLDLSGGWIILAKEKAH